MATDDLLRATIKAAHERWYPPAAERFPPKAGWEPLGLSVGTENTPSDQNLMGPVPTVPTVPTSKQYELRCTHEHAAAEALVAWEERAAIIQFEGGLSREDAERRATEEMGGR